MWPDWVSNPGPLALESDTLPTALRSLASLPFLNNPKKSRSVLKRHLDWKEKLHLITEEIQYRLKTSKSATALILLTVLRWMDLLSKDVTLLFFSFSAYSIAWVNFLGRICSTSSKFFFWWVDIILETTTSRDVDRKLCCSPFVKLMENTTLQSHINIIFGKDASSIY